VKGAGEPSSQIEREGVEIGDELVGGNKERRDPKARICRQEGALL
jgi:hypothetical protein